ncbi:peptidoglycan-binding protein [Allosalinactinospora lopnorensis]|uniref:peptidoglycan-binding protein n=1 Tax=Allosalinactinospora lopnorensis TaxID=1352348 RepID=UPI000696DB6C|nr:peptidoglycan-binding protein [Allosalinactinospora lopnorensis]
MSIQDSEDVTEPRPDPEEVAPAPGRPGARFVVALLLSLLLLAIAAMAWVLTRGAAREEPDAADMPEATAEVERTTLEEHMTMSGTLGYGSGATVFAGADGVLTRLPKQGEDVAPGEALYEVDGRPVVLLRGERPAYRVLEAGVTGTDVRQFEQALSELGYTGFTVDDEYTALTAAAVERWQGDIGVPRTGEVEPAGVWFAKRKVRVAELEAKVGQRVAPSVPILNTGSTGRVVRVEVEVADRALVEEGGEVEVALPGDERVKGEVTSIGAVAKEPDDRGGTGGDGGGEPTVDVTISLDSGAETGDLDQAPVDVSFRSARKEDVLAVPVSALIALPGGGYGVSVVDGETARDVPVETGMFADGKVEITEGDVDEGTTVVVPA